MAGKNNIELRVNVNTKTGIASLKKFSGEASDSFKKMGDEAKKTSNKISDSFKTIAATIATIGFGKVIKGIFDITVQFDRWNRTLDVTTEGLETLKQAQVFLRTESERLGLVYLDQVKSYAQLLAAAKETNLSLMDMKNIWLAVAEGSTAFQLSADDSYQAMRALIQMLQKGTISAEELRGQLGERLPKALQVMAMSVGVTTTELLKLMEEGKLMADQVLPDWAAKYREVVGGALPTATKSAQAEMNRLTNAWQSLSVAFARSGGFDVAVTAIKGLTKSLNSDEMKNGFETLKLSLKSVLEVVAELVPFIETIVNILLILMGLKVAVWVFGVVAALQTLVLTLLESAVLVKTLMGAGGFIRGSKMLLRFGTNAEVASAGVIKLVMALKGIILFFTNPVMMIAAGIIAGLAAAWYLTKKRTEEAQKAMEKYLEKAASNKLEQVITDYKELNSEIKENQKAIEEASKNIKNVSGKGSVGTDDYYKIYQDQLDLNVLLEKREKLFSILKGKAEVDFKSWLTALPLIIEKLKEMNLTLHEAIMQGIVKPPLSQEIKDLEYIQQILKKINALKEETAVVGKPVEKKKLDLKINRKKALEPYLPNDKDLPNKAKIKREMTSVVNKHYNALDEENLKKTLQAQNKLYYKNADIIKEIYIDIDKAKGKILKSSLDKIDLEIDAEKRAVKESESTQIQKDELITALEAKRISKKKEIYKDEAELQNELLDLIKETNINILTATGATVAAQIAQEKLRYDQAVILAEKEYEGRKELELLLLKLAKETTSNKEAIHKEYIQTIKDANKSIQDELDELRMTDSEKSKKVNEEKIAAYQKQYDLLLKSAGDGKVLTAEEQKQLEVLKAKIPILKEELELARKKKETQEKQQFFRDQNKERLDATKELYEKQLGIIAEFNPKYMAVLRELHAAELAELDAKMAAEIEKYKGNEEAKAAIEAKYRAQKALLMRKQWEEEHKMATMVIERISSGMSDMWGQLIDGTLNVKEAFKEMARSILKDLSMMIMKQLIYNALMSAMGASGGGSVWGSLFGVVAGVAGSYAGGSGSIGTTTAGGGSSTYGGALSSASSTGSGSFLGLPKAAGGPVQSGKGYLVGEKGPELFSPGTAGKIIPNNKLQSAWGQGGVVVNNNINVQSGAGGSDQDKEKLAKDIQRAVIEGTKMVLANEMRPGGMMNKTQRGY